MLKKNLHFTPTLTAKIIFSTLKMQINDKLFIIILFIVYIIITLLLLLK